MHKPTHPPPLILASTSRYRAELLRRLGVDFATVSPEIPEDPHPGEDAHALTRRLAGDKAAAVARVHPDAVVIGSDQVAEFQGRIIGKPGTVERACAQLLEFSGQTVRFLTAVSLQRESSGLKLDELVVTEIHFRELRAAEVQRYVEHDQPLDCAGSFKSERAGPVLMRGMRADDPTAIIGLPLIAVSGMLRQAGFVLP
ncbi:Maf family protein [Elongatibacter sediminis]|uniref:7-methyl-GTP pyrophosphatase n=1 Tax=Elongatibacter sediminis TaxID=3119006 RepID=A0AAW9RHN2_9GAMM